jgi:type IV pilus assembly protein PilA
MHTKAKKGFTLIELLVVIAIVAVLSVVVILTLNPAELLKQARDSSRVSDAATLKSAISLYLADYSSPNLAAAGYGNCYPSVIAATAGANCGGRYSAAYTTYASATSSRAIDSTGWLPVNFSLISSGSPVGNLPIDPVNNATYFYSYAATGTSLTFEIGMNMESSRYAQGGGGDVETTDGGNSSSTYEVGTVPGLAL